MVINRRSKASLITDAAVCIPVFLVAMGLMLLIIARAGVEDTVVRAGVYGASACIKASAAAEKAEGFERVLEAAAFASAFEYYLAQEWEDGPDAGMYWFSPEGERIVLGGRLRIDSVLRAEVSSSSKVPLPQSWIKSMGTRRSFVFRPWKGESERDVPEDGRIVYVFPKSGERYHAAECAVLKEGCVEAVLTATLRRQYSSCRLCDPGKLCDGAIVYMFSGSSKAFHRKRCSSISKYYTGMPKSEAEDAGYTPCMKCGGGI